MRYFRLIFAAMLFLTVVTTVILGSLYLYRNAETKVLTPSERRNAPGNFIKLTNGFTHYQLAGPDTGKVVILLHGFSVPYYMWDSTFNHLAAKGYRVLRYDAYGRGYSDRPQVKYVHELYLEQLNQLITALHLHTPVTLAGVSFGGRLAADFACRYPKLVGKLVMIDPAYESLMPDKPEVVSGYYETTHPNERAESQLADFKYPAHYPDWINKYRMQMQYKGFRHALISTMFNYTGTGKDAFSCLNAQHKPVLLIWGREDRTVPYAFSDSVRGVLKTEFFPVDDAAHLPMIEQAAKVNGRILEFLKEY